MSSIAHTETTQTYTAGRSGKDVRSDLAVHFTPRNSGGIEIELVSRVATYYGDSIKAQVLDVLKQMSVVDASVKIEDEGALPFVISARVEAAVRRAWSGKGKRVLPERTAHIPAAQRDRLRRSRLYLPGSEPKYFTNAALHQPDAVILDLEDSVHPSEKDASRILVRNALRCIDFAQCERMVRINQLPLGLADLEEVIPEHPDLILIPKTETPEQVIEVARKIAEVKRQYAMSGPIWLMPILESALGIENAFAIAKADESVVALTIGLEDYTADLGVVKTVEGSESLYARTRLVNAAKAAGVQAIDSVFGDVGDMDGLRAWGERSRGMGFEGMGCIHPGQIEIIHRAYAPTDKEIEKALKIVVAFEDAKAQGLGVVSLGSKMIDPPVVSRAVKLVQRAKQMGLVQ
ncbi:MAG TPA: aldolase/citrate lyase family protein [Terriglobales bacterium]|nr:aldolase/citrate lyase family protein [Terriglobales bacterium]